LLSPRCVRLRANKSRKKRDEQTKRKTGALIAVHWMTLQEWVVGHNKLLCRSERKKND
jgi:endonuclease III